MKDQRCALPRGKTLGGSSAINGLVYSRGWKQDYDRWEELGLQGWNYEKVLPYFKKSENTTLYPGDTYYHGTDGPLSINQVKPDHPLLKTFFQSQLQLQKSYTDYNADEMGYSRSQLTTKHGRRESGYTAFLKPIQERINLKLSTNSFVHKILIDKCDNNEAYAVEFIHNSRRYIAFAQKEIILSAGTFNSPQVLLLSGVGPKDDLQKLDIPVVADLPAVGKGLKEHPFTMNLVFRTNYTIRCPKLEDSVREFLKGKGELTAPGGMYAIAFAETKTKKNGIPDNELIFIPPTCNDRRPQKIFNPNDNLKKNIAKQRTNISDFEVFVVLLHPKSTGSVTLKSNNPRDFPVIDTNHFSDPDDLEILYRGIEKVLEWIETPAFRSVDARLLSGITDCDHHKKYSKSYWFCRIRHETSLLYHPIGTTKMATSKEMGVVDTRFKLFGVKYLRVIDAGTIPVTVSGHTNAATFMIAERAADFIKCEYGMQKSCE